MVKNLKAMMKAVNRKEYGLATIGLVLFTLEVVAIIMFTLLVWEMNTLGWMLIEGNPRSFNAGDIFMGFMLVSVGNIAMLCIALYYVQSRYPQQASRIVSLANWLAYSLTNMGSILSKRFEDVEERYKALANTDSEKEK